MEESGEIDFSAEVTSGMRRDGILHLSPRDALRFALRGAVIVDLRDDYETNFRQFDVPLAVSIPMRDLQDRIGELDGQKPLILADAVGLRSKEAVCRLMSEGFTNVANLSGGMVDWDRDGLPVKKDAGYELGGQCACKIRSKKGGKPD